MDKKELANILSEMLVPRGFKKKGDYWVMNGDVITKVVNLQKSKFENSFYINYGYILKSIPLENLTMHVFKGLGSVYAQKNERIIKLLNLSNDISDANRTTELRQLILEKIIGSIQAVNTEEALLNELKNQPHLNDIPLVVKRYFNLEER